MIALIRQFNLGRSFRLQKHAFAPLVKNKTALPGGLLHLSRSRPDYRPSVDDLDWACPESQCKMHRPVGRYFCFHVHALTSCACAAFYENKNARGRAGGILHLSRSRPDSNWCSSFCRAEPSHSATGPFLIFEKLFCFAPIRS